MQILCQFSAYKFDIGGQEVYFDEMNVYSVFCKFWAYKFDIGGQEVDKMTVLKAK